MGSIERQEERWTAALVGRLTGSRLRYYLRDNHGRHLALIEVENTDEGRSTVAKMVAALQMEQALKVVLAEVGRKQVDGYHENQLHSDDVATVAAALEAAKRLQP